MTNSYDEKERRIHCAFSEKCGGCDYAGMKYNNELAVKQKYIEELFGEYVKVDDIVGMTQLKPLSSNFKSIPAQVCII